MMKSIIDRGDARLMTKARDVYWGKKWVVFMTFFMYRL